MLRKLAGYPRQNPVARALREIGWGERILFLLDWLDDADLRRRTTNANLNKGEAHNALARAVFFNRLGKLRGRTFENQRHRASGLNLIVSAITHVAMFAFLPMPCLRYSSAVFTPASCSRKMPMIWFR